MTVKNCEIQLNFIFVLCNSFISKLTWKDDRPLNYYRFSIYFHFQLKKLTFSEYFYGFIHHDDGKTEWLLTKCQMPFFKHLLLFYKRHDSYVFLHSFLLLLSRSFFIFLIIFYFICPHNFFLSRLKLHFILLLLVFLFLKNFFLCLWGDSVSDIRKCSSFKDQKWIEGRNRTVEWEIMKFN